jgi:hypothetical protein
MESQQEYETATSLGAADSRYSPEDLASAWRMLQAFPDLLAGGVKATEIAEGLCRQRLQEAAAVAAVAKKMEERMQCSLRFNHVSAGAGCPACGNYHKPDIGYQVCQDDPGSPGRKSFAILCPECAQRLAPELAAVLEAANAAYPNW